MAQGRGTAVAILGTVVVALLLLHSELAEATNYTVGDARGWTFNVSHWPIGKRFKAGDVLAFNYNPAHHSVVQVSKKCYKSCSIPEGANVYNTGHDLIKLKKGRSYFICGFRGHCKAGVRIAVKAK